MSEVKDLEDVSRDIASLDVSGSSTNVSKKRPLSSDLETTENPTKKDKKRVPEHLEKDFKVFRGISEKSVRYQSHLDFLNRYLGENKVPRGLLWSTTPSFGKNNQGFIKAWKDHQLASSIKLLELICGVLSEEIKEFLKKATEAKSAIYANANSDAEADEVVTFVGEIITRRKEAFTKRKERKFEADIAGKPRFQRKQSKWTKPKSAKKDEFSKEQITAIVNQCLKALRK